MKSRSPESAKILVHHRRPALLAALFLVFFTAGFRSSELADKGLHRAGAGSPALATGDTLDIILDAAGAGRVEITAYWKRLTGDDVDGAYGPIVLSDEGLNADSDVRFIPEFTASGDFEVALYWPSLRNPDRKLATDVRVTVRHAEGEKRFRINQRENPEEWYLLGRFPFEPGKPGHVQFITDEANGVVLADAVRFRLFDAPLE